MFFLTYLQVFSIFFFTNIECKYKFEVEEKDERMNVHWKNVINGYFVEKNRRVVVKVIEGPDVWFSVKNMGTYNFSLMHVDHIRKVPIPPKLGTRGVSTYDPEEAFIETSNNLLNCSLSAFAAVNPKAKIMIISQNFDEDLAAGVFEQAWKLHKILNLVLVDTSNEVYYVHNPFKTELTIYHASQVLDFPTHHKNRLKDLNGHILRANVFATPLYCKIVNENHFEWFCGEFLDSIRRIMNMTVKYVEPLSGSNYGAFVNGQFIGALREIEDDRVDVSATLRGFGFWYNATQLTMMAPVTGLQLCYAVPNEYFPATVKIFHFEFFDTITCALIGISMLAILLVSYVIITVLKFEIGIVKYFFVMISIASSVSVYHLPTQQTLRILLGILLLVFVIINSSYQGLIITSLNASKPRNLKTMDELVKTNFTIYLPFNIERLTASVKKLPPEHPARILYHRSILTEIDNRPEVKKVAETRRAAACIPDFYFGNYKTDFLNNRTGDTLLYMLPDCPYTYYLSPSIPRNSPFMEKFNDILLRLVESGLENHQYKVALAELSLSKIRLAKSGMLHERTLKLISMEELWYLFVYFGIMLGVAVAVFLMEIIFSATFSSCKRGVGAVQRLIINLLPK